MKKITILLVLAAFTLTSKAQDFFDAGIKAGLNTSKISTHISDYSPQTINNYSVGAFVRLNLGRVYLQPEVYYNSKGGEYIDEVNLSTVNSFDLKAVDVPALVGLKIINQKSFNVRVLAGPVFSFVTDKSVEGSFSKNLLEDNFFGWQYGAGVDILFLTFDARFQSYSDDIYSSPDFDTKNGTFVLSLGIKLF
jgi:hypothetical protein